MFGFWYIVFGAAGLTAIGAALWIIFAVRFMKVYKTLNSEDQRQYRLGGIVKDRQKLNTYENWCAAGQIITAIAGMILLISTIIAAARPVEGRKDVAYFKAQSEYIEMSVENGNMLENVNITHTIIEQNTWLAKAKANLEAYGIWSCYYGSGLEELEPIVIER